VKNIAANASEKEYHIGKFEESHSNVDEKLNDLRNILMKYLPSVCDSLLAIKVLSHLYKLEYDLKKHTSIENNILIPLVNKLEKNDN
jgi:regulator of cell morphogenesis and NO signaling